MVQVKQYSDNMKRHLVIPVSNGIEAIIITGVGDASQTKEESK